MTAVAKVAAVGYTSLPRQETPGHERTDASSRSETVRVDGPSAEAVRAQLVRGAIPHLRKRAGPPPLPRAHRRCYPSGEDGRAEEYALGVDVFGRGESFEPRVDTIVRVQARRLRSKLEEYYDTDGRNDPLLIELPRAITFRCFG